MPRDLFGDVAHPSMGLGSRKWYTLPLSLVLHTAVVAAVVIVPLMAADVLPTPSTVMAFVVGTPAPPVPPQAPIARAAARPALLQANAAAAPLEAPSGVGAETGLVVEPESTVGVEGGMPNGIAGSILTGLPEAAPPPPSPTAPIRVSLGIRAPTKVKDVSPIYPTIAQAARVQGVVILEAVIGSDGVVKEARVLRSIPLLDQAALDAVRQWVFTPTLLSGVPVPIVMTVTVSFTLK
jgi:protein TonB